MPSVESTVMTRFRSLATVVALLLAVCTVSLAEKVADLPAPTGYVNDFAGVLTPQTKQSVEDLCTQVDKQAHAQIAVVTVKTIEGDESIEEFTTQLEDKWKVGQKGTDRGLLMLFVMTPRKGRIEVGYGLEGILNDAKVGDIGRMMAPYAQQNDYNQAISLGVQQIAQVIATDAGVSLDTTQTVHRYHRQPAQTVSLSPVQVIVGLVVGLIILVVLIKTGNIGLIFFLLGNIMGGGGGGGGRDRDDDRGGGGFGGFGGGSSGGGGASGDW